MKKILVADDKQDNLYFMKSMFDEEEFQIIAAINGSEALDLARRNLPDIIISDILMPEMDGFMFCRECKKDPLLKKIPFIFYTATYTDPKDEEFALSLGASRFILKPQEPVEILKIINSILGEIKENKIHPEEYIQQTEMVVLKEYNETLIRKLEDKMVHTRQAENDLKKINSELEMEIKKRQKIEETLQERELWLSSIYDTVGDVIYYLSVEGDECYRFISVNHAFCEVTGMSEKKIIGRLINDVIPEPSLTIVLGKYRQAIDKKNVIRWEETSDYPTGQLIGEVSISPVFDAKGRCTHLVGSVHDITERKRIEEEILHYRDHLEEIVRERTAELLKSEHALKLAKEQAEAANMAKTVFLSSMSHEIRTPLNAVLGFSQLMLKDESLTGRQIEWLNTINRSGEHLLALINDILEISRIESGRVSLSPDLFDLKAFLRDIEKMFFVRIEEKNLELRMVIDPGIPGFIEVDGNKLRQIFINLIGNAIKFTDEGKITVRVSSKRKKNGSCRLIAEVEDTGPGITPEDLNKIFTKFEQTAISHMKGGTGLGLSISRQFARLMGGDITVRSEDGKGSCFLLELDFKERKEPELEFEKELRNIKGLKKGQRTFHILIADDEPANRMLLKDLLNKAGFDVEEAADGSEVLIKFKERTPDLVFLDMRMPVMDGSESIKRMKSLQKNVPVIAVTANAFDNSIEKMKDLGLDGYIRKPYKINEIYDVLKSKLGVQFTYAKDSSKKNKPDKLTVSDLPENLARRMLEAALRVDLDSLLELIDEAGKTLPAISSKLRVMAKNFKYDELIKLLKSRRKI
jgi:PAS domain S-box-containing protein